MFCFKDDNKKIKMRLEEASKVSISPIVSVLLLCFYVF